MFWELHNLRKSKETIENSTEESSLAHLLVLTVIEKKLSFWFLFHDAKVVSGFFFTVKVIQILVNINDFDRKLQPSFAAMQLTGKSVE